MRRGLRNALARSSLQLAVQRSAVFVSTKPLHSREVLTLESQAQGGFCMLTEESSFSCCHQADEIEKILCHKFMRFMMMRAENFFILRRKPVEVRPMFLVFVITRVLSLGGPGLFDFCSYGRRNPRLCTAGQVTGRLFPGSVGLWAKGCCFSSSKVSLPWLSQPYVVAGRQNPRRGRSVQCPPSQNLGPSHRLNSDFKILPALGVVGILALLTKTGESCVWGQPRLHFDTYFQKREGKKKGRKTKQNLPKLSQLKSRLSKPQ